MKERDNVLRILEETKKAINEENADKLNNLSNQTINTASLTHDPDNITVAVIVYSLSKIIGRENYKHLRGWNSFHNVLLMSLNKAISDIKKGDEEGLRMALERIRGKIGSLSGKLKSYIKDVFRRASINKASRIYEHGISMERTAKLLGITIWELADYVGKTGIAEVPLGRTMDAKSRIKLAERIFK